MMRGPQIKRLIRLEEHLKPGEEEATIGGMRFRDILSRLSSSERDYYECALISLTENEDDSEAIDIIDGLVSLASERKDAGLICISYPKAPFDYNEEIREARLIYREEAWKHVSRRVEYFIDENNKSQL